ncbi:hypothetical protein [Streptomyces sp. MST-110588]|uniref:hypothetical protein n=1 Tax=Streptomyces sp. MST-110588 TaxID=2833628 RepID=UPI001F5CB406|nr:hypothetical protein [Streptomyces sp. MST-110588]UNO38447.1 hypothetical protein KGS77_00760 [Streptomyces sp. MST-110588]
MPEQEERTDAAAPAAATGRSSTAGLEQAALLAVGLADLVLERLRRTAERGQQVLRRSDLREVLSDGVNDLRIRGELASRRVTPSTENYLELMACRAAKRAESTHA